ncbi:MAG: cytidine deaminase [Planctomycetes bacterium]|nr:cytidine deaminase [Planctomycetota bacterium]MDA0948506.1 cytidine deaminase [Planctomycetota bacterium]
MTEPIPEEDRLVEAARAVLAQAHAPYSGYAVGAALLDADGRIHVGCNVENASFGLTICAERTAVAHAVTLGARTFQGLVIAFAKEPVVPPCGACRQVLAEFAPDLPVAWVGSGGVVGRARLGELLPGAFDGGFLAVDRTRPSGDPGA